jgi:phosphoribosylpyrophosphate synthetase
VLQQRVELLSVAPLLAEAIGRIHRRESLTELWLDAEA